MKKLYPEFHRHKSQNGARTAADGDGHKAWVVSVDIGYGHQRAAYPFREIAWERIITANNDPMISEEEKKYWANARDFYERLSRMRESNFVGRYLFDLYDRLQSIDPFFPMRDLSRPSRVVRYLRRRIEDGLCRSLVEHLRQKPMPILTTHFIPALAAEYLGLENIYCVVTDTDINRVWVPEDPKSTRITYLAPSRHALTRLKTYGIPESRLHLTGFPLPHELVGGRSGDTIKIDLGRRLPQLDPQRKFRENYEPLLRTRLGEENYHEQPVRPLTIAYMVGGAGAQRGIGIQIVQGLRGRIDSEQVRIILVAGVRDEVAAFFREELGRIGVTHGVDIICHPDKFEYFRQVNEALRETDLVWTKPSELIFYTALGLPVIMSPPVGAHEGINQRWLENIGSGFPQQDLDYVEQWLFYILESGKFAEAAWDGFINATAMGAYRIEDALFHDGPTHAT